MKLWPVFVLSLTKSPALHVSAPSLDLRVYILRLWLDLAQDALMPMLYPRMLAVHSYLSAVLKGEPNGSLCHHMCRLSKDLIDRNGIYLIGMMCPSL
jgi:hypothetical protein